LQCTWTARSSAVQASKTEATNTVSGEAAVLGMPNG